MFELEEVRTWERNPQLYADTLATSLAGQALFDYAPLAERARRVALQAAAGAAADPGGARQHQGSARHLRQGRPREPARHAALHRATICRARFVDVDDLHVLGDLADASTEATNAIGAYVDYLENDWRRGARARSASGASASSRSCSSRKASRSAPIGCWRSPSASCSATQEEFRRVASRVNGGDPARGVGEDQGASIRRPGSWCRRRSSSSTSWSTFLKRERIVTVPEGAPVVGRADAAVLSLDVREHVDAGAVRERGRSRAFYYITDVDPSWPPERQDEHLRDFNYGDALGDLDPRGVSGPLPPLPAPAPGGLEAAQVDPVRAARVRRRLGALLRADDDRRRASARRTPASVSGSSPKRSSASAGSSSASGCTPRTCRWSRACACSASEALLEEASARREAERGTFDPAYMVYSVGKLMLLKLREDYKAHAGRGVLAARVPRHAARQRHAAVLGCIGQLMLGDRQSGEHDRVIDDASLRVPVRRLRTPLRGIQKFSDPLVDTARSAAAGAQADVVAGDPVQGHRAGTSPTTRKKGQGSESSSDKADSRRRAARASRDARSDRQGHRVDSRRRASTASKPAPAPTTEGRVGGPQLRAVRR